MWSRRCSRNELGAGVAGLAPCVPDPHRGASMAATPALGLEEKVFYKVLDVLMAVFFAVWTVIGVRVMVEWGYEDWKSRGVGK